MSIKMKRMDGRDGNRFYEVRADVYYPSYTTVLQAMPMAPFLVKWLKDKTASESSRLLKMAGLKGSKIHHTIELILIGQEVSPFGISDEQIKKLDLSESELVAYLKAPFTEDEDMMLRGFLNFCKDYKPKTVLQEFTVYSDKLKCAGTCDWIGTIELTKKNKKTGKENTYHELVIIDWKTGKGIYPSHSRQIAGYYYAVKEMIKKKLIKTKMPKQAFLLHLKTTKKGYELVKVDDLAKEYKKMCRVKDEWDDMNPNARPDKGHEYMEYYSLEK